MSQQTSAAANTQRGGGLGTTIHPEGTSGQVLDQPTLVDRQLNAPVNPAYTTSFETVEAMLSRTWVYANTFSISTQMTPGQIIFARPIHPEFANQYNAHVVKMMNTWMGGYKIRIRIPATAFYGGSIRVAFLPPNNTLASIRAMSLETLTVYPSRDLDPKNTDWIDFQMPDQRNIEFHYYLTWKEIQELMTSDPKGINTHWPTLIGGWFVCFVVAPLVAQSDSTQTVQMVLECSGSFVYRQPNPRFQLTDSNDPNPPPEQGGPLTSGTLNRLLSHAGCDTLYVGFGPRICIHHSSLTALTDGGFNTFGFNGKRPWEFPASSASAAAKQLSLQFSEAEREQSTTPTNTMAVPFRKNTYDFADGKSWWSPWSGVGGGATAFFGTALAGIAHEDLKYYVVGSGYVCGAKRLDKVAYEAGVDYAIVSFGAQDDADLGNEVSVPVFNPAAIQDVLTPNEYLNKDLLIKPMVSGESIVTFQNQYPRTVNMQPLQAMLDLRESKNLDENTSYVYSLRNTANPNIIVRYIRLNPNGMFTTTGQSTDAMIVADTNDFSYWYLKFEQSLPVSDPLPSVSEKDQMRWATYCRGLKKMFASGKTVTNAKVADWAFFSLIAGNQN